MRSRIFTGREGDGQEQSNRARYPKRQRTQPQTNYSDEEGSEEEEDPSEDEDYVEERNNQRREEDAASEEQVQGEDTKRCGGKLPDQPRNHMRNGSMRNGPISWTVTDPEILDCPVCFEPLTIPVFQCEDGHIVCSSCCSQMSQCAACTLPIGYIRCRAIEKVIECVKVKCPNTKYGCNETMNYSLKLDHERACQHAPCSCPLSDCNFLGTSTKLYLHFRDTHSNTAINFHYNKVFHLTLNVNHKFIVLQEETDGGLFILNNRTGSSGNMIWVSFISPSRSVGVL